MTLDTIYYFDNAAYWKYYRGQDEQGYLALRRFVSRQTQPVWLSSLTILEFVSRLAKEYRQKRLKRKRINTALKTIRRDIGLKDQSRPFTVIPLPSGIYQEAEGLLLAYAKYDFGTMDALHTAIVKRLQQVSPYITMVTSDNSLKNVCDEISINQFDPEIELN